MSFKRFNMVEIVIAMVIVLVALIGILGLIPKSTQTSQDAISRSSAADGADQVLRFLKMRIVSDSSGMEIGNIPTEKYSGDDRQVPYTTSLGLSSADSIDIMYDGAASPPYRTLKVVQRTAMNQTDFEGVMRVWRTETATAAGKQETLQAEMSWPANVAYEKRNKQVYSYNVFKATSVAAAAPPALPMFTVNNGVLVVNRKVNVTAVTVGAAMSYGGLYDMPVTCDILVNGTSISPFGDINKPISGARVDGASHTFNIGLLDVGTQVVVLGKGWMHKGSGPWTTDAKWQAYSGPPSPPVSSTPATNQVLVLKNGDQPPLTPGFSGQASAKDYLKPYLTADGHVVLPHPDNDVLYLFEMGGTNQSSSSFDRNDLIVLISGTDATN